MTKVVTPKAPKAKKPTPATTPKPTKTADDPKIMWQSGKKNPFAEKSGAHKRVECVRTNSGRTRSEILAKKVARSSTIAYCLREGLAKRARAASVAALLVALGASDGRAATLNYLLDLGPQAGT